MTASSARTEQERGSFGVLASLLAIAIVVALDYLTGIEISFAIFYVAPIAYVTWHAGRRFGIGFALMSAAAWYTVDRMGGNTATHFLIPVWNAIARMGLFLLTVEAMARLRASLFEARRLARSDPVTSLPNGRAFREVVTLELDRVRRYPAAFSVAYVDVDNFKGVNDTLGHDSGDRLLAEVGRTLRTNLRASDTPARLGGDEFAILMPHTALDAARATIGKLETQLAATTKRHGWPVSFSIGLACFETPPGDVDELLRSADRLMYEVKHTGKNAIKSSLVEPAARTRARTSTS